MSIILYSTFLLMNIACLLVPNTEYRPLNAVAAGICGAALVYEVVRWIVKK